MGDLVAFDLPEGGSVVVEVEPGAGGYEPVGRRGVAGRAAVSFVEALEPLREAVGAVVAKVRAVAEPPDEVEVEMGVRLSASAGAVITNWSGEAHLRVRLTWKRAPEA